MALYLDIYRISTKDLHKTLHGFATCFFSTLSDRRCKRTFVSTRKADQAT